MKFGNNKPLGSDEIKLKSLVIYVDTCIVSCTYSNTDISTRINATDDITEGYNFHCPSCDSDLCNIVTQTLKMKDCLNQRVLIQLLTTCHLQGN